VRPFFLAWLTLALLLLGMGRLSRAGNDVARAGFATATGQKPADAAAAGGASIVTGSDPVRSRHR
jgi:hypothetical protein